MTYLNPLTSYLRQVIKETNNVKFHNTFRLIEKSKIIHIKSHFILDCEKYKNSSVYKKEDYSFITPYNLTFAEGSYKPSRQQVVSVKIISENNTP